MKIHLRKNLRKTMTMAMEMTMAMTMATPLTMTIMITTMIMTMITTMITIMITTMIMTMRMTTTMIVVVASLLDVEVVVVVVDKVDVVEGQGVDLDGRLMTPGSKTLQRKTTTVTTDVVDGVKPVVQAITIPTVVVDGVGEVVMEGRYVASALMGQDQLVQTTRGQTSVLKAPYQPGYRLAQREEDHDAQTTKGL